MERDTLMKRKTHVLPSNERLNELFTYNPETGELRRKVSRSGAGKVGSLAGTVDKLNGYRLVGVDRILYKAHRICFKMATGFDVGVFEIDHINGDRLDNRLSNLRMVSTATNLRNQKRRGNNTSGHTGVSFNKQLKKWDVRIHSNNKQFYLGSFTEKEDAVAVRKEAEKKYKYHPNHGRVE